MLLLFLFSIFQKLFSLSIRVILTRVDLVIKQNCVLMLYTLNFLKVFLEQKKILKSGLNIANFRQHVSIIEKETKEYFQSWGEGGEKSKQNVLGLHLS